MRTRRRDFLELLSPLARKKRGTLWVPRKKTSDAPMPRTVTRTVRQLFSGGGESALNRGAMAGEADLPRAAT